MDIEEFYDEDPRRRSSSELELGRDWHDVHGVRYELSWVEDTGELYVMREPAPDGWATPFGGIHVWHAHSTDEQEIAGMTVAVLGVMAARSDVDSALAGWEEAMTGLDSIAWLVGRLHQVGLLQGTVATEPDATEPDATELDALEPAATEPVATEPSGSG